ncbi:proline-rich receptor-like protein kinase PERK8 [Cucurbita maxima]|uniref:Proline-rich receptor-like protein kinase PERK8 n=1 Tax=Cucurbita maxima TaxID=3661 RepID=A0A6J1I0V7_CUCMA|nr:proline-rich receptor-like protein kinase PERK8 [Cucurbita maxima]
MVQRVWTGWDSSLLDTIAGIDVVVVVGGGMGMVCRPIGSAVMDKGSEVYFAASQTSTLAPSTPVVPLHDPSYLSIHPPPSIPPSPPIPSPTTSSSPPPSPDLPTNSNPIPPDTSAPLRRSTRTKQPPAWHKDYEMSYGANHLTSSSGPGTGTRQLSQRNAISQD